MNVADARDVPDSRDVAVLMHDPGPKDRSKVRLADGNIAANATLGLSRFDLAGHRH